MDLIIERLDKSKHNRNEFDCGKEELHTFIKLHANNNQKLNISVTHVAISQDDSNQNKSIYAYYTLSSGHITYDELPDKLKSKLPKYPVPIARICRLAVDESHQKQGIGEFLLFNAFSNILESAKKIAIYAIVVDAKDAEAKAFYKQYGFIELQRSALTLFLPLKTIQLASSTR